MKWIYMTMPLLTTLLGNWQSGLMNRFIRRALCQWSFYILKMITPHMSCCGVSTIDTDLLPSTKWQAGHSSIKFIKSSTVCYGHITSFVLVVHSPEPDTFFIYFIENSVRKMINKNHSDLTT